jgi:hypothetical protein
MARDEDPEDFYQLVHPGGPVGVVKEKPNMKEQDSEFEPAVFYAVVFFPKIDSLGPATFYQTKIHTLSQSPEAAKMKFMDGILKGETWETYEDAGWRVRKVQISDLGDAEVDTDK